MGQSKVLAFSETMRLFGNPTTRLERRKVSDRAWQQYVIDGVQPEGIGEEIVESWQRVRESYGIDPGLKQPKRILTPDALEDRRLRDEVLALATPVLRDFSARLGLADHVLAFFDREGFMLSIDGAPGVVEGVRDIAFAPGVNWSEDSAGTNGPGTALASGKAVEVCASEHFVTAWQPWSCAAAPVHAPGEAAPVGLVDITGPWEVRRRQAILMAQAIARAIEERIRAACCVRDEVVRHAFRAAHGSGDALVAVDSTARVIAANDAASRRAVAEAGMLSPALRQEFLRALRARKPGADPDVRLEIDGREVVATVVEYDRTTVGAIVRAPAVNPPRSRGRSGPQARYEFNRILGRSEQLREAVELARKASRNDLPAVIYGESGTGKELFAHAIHAASGRQGGPFVPVNCGSIPAQLVEAELFGYESGTFTGARREGNPGRFEDANGGTLFLDEVSELPPPAQTALLRVLQEREVVRLGGSAPRRVDVRVVAATNKPLEAEIRAGRFRRDLYYRLNVLPIRVPPLRERGDDVGYLALVFLGEAEAEVGREKLSLAADAVAALRAHHWPGNVRELKNVILRAAATAPGAHIRAEDLLLDLGMEGPAAAAPAASASAASAEPGAEPQVGSGALRDAVLESERTALLAALEACEWNVARAAQRLCISRMTLYRRLHKLGISRAPARSA
jgi:transcriptional regulator of acetoin/glycerol metabolism